MTQEDHKPANEPQRYGQFEVSATAAQSSRIEGPAEILGLVFVNWKSVAVVVAFLFIVVTYQSRIDRLENQMSSLSHIYESLPEDKQLAVGALRSVEELRPVFTVMVEERVRELVDSEVLLRGGSSARRRVSEVEKLATGFEHLWAVAEQTAPAIYTVVQNLGAFLDGSVDQTSFSEITSSDSATAYGVARYLLAHQSQETGGSGALANLRHADRVLGPSSVVRRDLLRFELAAADAAALVGDSKAWTEIYSKGWNRWADFADMSESVEHSFRYSHGVAGALVVPFYAVSVKGEGSGLSLEDFKAGVGKSLPVALGIGVGECRRALSANVHRPSALVVSAEIDLAVERLLASDALTGDVKEGLWDAYQTSAGRFQDVSLGLAPKALVDRAGRLLVEASHLSESHGEVLDLGDTIVHRSLFQSLPAEVRETLGLPAPPPEPADESKEEAAATE